MGQYWLNVAILRIAVPGTFTACTIWRPTALSLIYLILMLISPFIPIPTSETMKRTTGHYLKSCIALTFITSVIQFIFQIILVASPSIWTKFTENCSFLEELFRHFGLVRMDGASTLEVFYWLLPEILTLPIMMTLYILCRRFTSENNHQDLESTPVQDQNLQSSLRKYAEERNAKIINFLGRIGTYIVLASLCYTATLSPSVEGGFYFLVFFGAGTWWACNRELVRNFAIICRVVMVVVVGHIVVLMSYQNQWPQEYIPVDSRWSRYFALEAYYKTNCTDPRNTIFTLDNDDWTQNGYAYALRLFWLYYILALQSKFLFQSPNLSDDKPIRLSQKLKSLDTQITRHVSMRRKTPSQRWQSARRKAYTPTTATSASLPDERTPNNNTYSATNITDTLMRFGSGRAGLLQDSTGSVTVQDGHNDDNIQMQSIVEDTQEDNLGVIEQVIMAIYSILQLFVHSSYLATNIIMMTWSIMYHSWTTFVFLLWALIIWMAPNKRSAMMKCSPFVVMYGTILLLICYVYSMNLTPEERPDQIIGGVPMSEVGFPNANELKSWHLMVKCGFMVMFWITMRQYMSERHQARQTSALRDMIAPLRVSVSAATAMHQETPEIKSKFMKDVGLVVKKLLTKFWIVVVAIMLFTSGITGERMTMFRIMYMTLFLFFVISFQISWVAWRKMMYGFWITVIAYSVIMLILVYTYQFRDFTSYWEHLGINERLQNDIGLEVYKTKDLFVRLLTPTFFVIITVIQIHYFHDDFLEATDIDKIQVLPELQRADSEATTVPPTSTLDVLLGPDQEASTIFTLRQLKHMSKLERAAFFRRTVKQLMNFYNYLWLILEIHIQKIVFTSLILLCINDVCAINLIFVTAIVIIINFGRPIQIMGINSMSVVIALLMVTKMLYQIQYIDPDKFNVNCTRENPDNGNQTLKTYNIAEWIGLKKASAAWGDTSDSNANKIPPTNDKPSEQEMLAYLLKGYIGIVIVTTLRAIITVRQSFYRRWRGEPLEMPEVMFPKIKRAEADKGIAECLKFFLNYGFYKFGLEFCLIGIVILIRARIDFYSVVYGVWLLVFFAQSRRVTASIWPFFRVFAIILLPLQYFFVVAPPTWLCINYPWINIYRRLQEWMYLPDPDNSPNPRKLICDFFLLYMIVRQSLVFNIEANCSANNIEHPAGHNYSVFRDMDKPNFVNPVKDYVSFIHNWLDVIKRGVMMSFMWITLSMMFLAGTNRTNIFSLGYLIGSFIFLWQGSDFYLRPLRVILRWWNFLIGYNVVVIFLKVLFQGFGCILITQFQKSACWLVQLLGIACYQYRNSQFKIDVSDDIKCQMLQDDSGLMWDGFCFAFLIIQKRLFKSYYFFHIVDETKAMSILASRGAELLENLHRKRIEFQESVENTILQNIKLKMDKIKADQQKIHGPSWKEPAHHKVGMAPLARTCSASSYVSSGHTPPQGYQTPIDDDSDTDNSSEDLQDDKQQYDPPPLTPRASSLLQAPSPNSAIVSVSLEGYLEPTRISFGSPPSSELNPRGVSPDETFPVFSPPPYDQPANSDQSCQSLLKSIHRQRQSSLVGTNWNPEAPTISGHSAISITSRSQRSHHTSVRSGDYYMFDDVDDEDVTEALPDSEMEIDEEEQRRLQRHKGRRMTVSELMSTLFKTDIEIATHVAMYGGTSKDALRLRRQSMPLSRKKSSMSYLSARSETETAATTDEVDRSSEISGEVQARRKSRKNSQKSPSRSGENADDKDSSATSLEDDEAKKRVSFLTYFKFLFELINSFMISATRHLNKFSRDYRYIRKVLSKEKLILKAKPDFRMGMRLGINQIWQPIPLMKDRSETEASSKETVAIEDPDQLEAKSESSMLTRTQPISQVEEEEPQLSEVDQPTIIQLLASIWFGILAHSTFMCYFMIFLHQINNASVLSVPLPLMVFFWGSLTIPRPSKTFWVTIIAYTEAIVIIKCIFQWDLIAWNQVSGRNPLATTTIIGVDRKTNYALWDLLLLLMVFFHRFMLKSIGQWTTPYATRKIIPSKLVIGPDRPSPASGPSQAGSTRLQWQNEEQTQSNQELNSVSTSKDLPKAAGTSDETNSDYHNTDSDEERLVEIRNEETNVCDAKLTTAVSMTFKKYLEPTKGFFANILNPDGKEKTNVYAYMFLCDFFNFLLIIFRFSSFGNQQGDGGVTAYLQENRVPMPFLIMMLIQFALIVIDRALYLRKSILGKLAFQYALIVGIHIWMFFFLPGITGRAFNDSLPPQIWYIIKCFYLLLAAYQLRLGYPTRILGNFLCKKYNIVNYCLFKGFMLIPFLFELRAVMDWIWTDTSMTVMDWFKMEDIFASIYQIKCMRGLESDFPQPRGEKKKQMSKYLVGGGLLLVIIGLIWFPLLLFALSSTVGVSNIPSEVSLRIQISSHEPIYTATAQDASIFSYTDEEFKALKGIYTSDRPAYTFLDNYGSGDVATVKLSKSTQRIWGITPLEKEQLKNELKSNITMNIHVEWAVSRKTDAKDFSGISTTPNIIPLPAYVNGEFNPIRTNLSLLLSSENDNPNVTLSLPHVFPKFLKITSRNTSVVEQLMHAPTQIYMQDEIITNSPDNLYRNVTLQLVSELGQQWWMIQEQCNDNLYNKVLKNVPLNDCSNNIVMFMFNEKAFPEGLSFFSGMGILGLYTTAVIVVSQLMRRIVSDMAPKIMFDDMPYVDRILKLCLDIYLVRESKELSLEEDLFAKLIFLYRSPETLIRWTRPPESNQDDDRDDNEDFDEPDDNNRRNNNNDDDDVDVDVDVNDDVNDNGPQVRQRTNERRSDEI
ncbi:piezo-type mechanosensitive ion channel component isoform X3 [Cotesia glomerata]|uniref:piezo-type mechanosensitive ion channel component isoform X3 n=1 Tax=Cotesia glomerata TaxID=32391 RepID=UPI001D0134F9|nr:piezo-type mechanosensitive ion channel component isoform X3 [Cotesia glomerata]